MQMAPNQLITREARSKLCDLQRTVGCRFLRSASHNAATLAAASLGAIAAAAMMDLFY
jgi:hypothetical protein